EWRVKTGREEIAIGQEFYKEVDIDKKLVESQKPKV
ncbi:MAG: hypothetical protein ACJATL_000282, partial [Rickettsiales bacterium]